MPILICCGGREEEKGKTLFSRLPSSVTGISFENTLRSTDEFNIIEYLYFYNGGGVAAGDVNNDGWVDLYFSANQGSNRLYLNKGDFEFDDVTGKAGVAGVGNWKTGVTMADVNGDKYLDIFVCGVGNYKNFNGRNQLFINNGDLTFTDKAAEYGLDFQGFSTQAAFFDYDNDGDLDMYLLNHSVHSVRSYGDALLRLQSDAFAGDKLYRNELIPSGSITFTEVTSQAGIFNSQIGYGLGIAIADLNFDGFADIYVSNDFHENDYLYINLGNGTFTQELEKSVGHASRFSMGSDIADINNDALADIVTLDMLPKDEYVIKTTAGEDTYEIFEYKHRFGYHYQFSRNALQINQGLDEEDQLIFSDIAPFAGIEATDWSWAPLLADFDNDGKKDLFITNGIMGRPNDLDYINYISRDSAQRFFSDQQLFEQMPSGKMANVFFRHGTGLSFENVTDSWTGMEETLSNGAAYADLDNDGDLDLIVNNLNEPAFVLRNGLPAGSGHFLKIRLEGTAPNTSGVGSKIIVYAGDEQFYQEQMPTRGWLSSVDPVIHTGLGNIESVDSAVVVWPGGYYQTITDVKIDQTFSAVQNQANRQWDYQTKKKSKDELLQPMQIDNFVHKENDYNALESNRLIPHMLSTQGPKISVGDLNNDQLEDFFIGGASGQPGAIFIQGSGGNFRSLLQPALLADAGAEDVGSALLDADGDGDPDLIVVGGGQEYQDGDERLRPRLYHNDGKGNFRRAEGKLPDIFLQASCVKPADIDQDGDQDLFIGGRMVAGVYGLDPASYILLNDGKGKFRDATASVLQGKPGMVTDANWLDLNADGKPDMVIVGEWMPVTILINSNGVLQDQTKEFGLEKTNGWWNTVEFADLDQDGDLDLVAGNLGLNSRLHASENEPVEIFIGDIDGNSGIEQVITYFNNGVRYPFISRDQLVRQVPLLKRKFPKYSDYGNVKLENILTGEQLTTFVHKRAELFGSVFLENLGNEKFSIHLLPDESQLFPIFSFQIDDVNGDKKQDLLAVGNLFAVQPDFGRYDAGYGLVMIGDGKGNFKPESPSASGLIVKGEARDIKSLLNSKGETIYLVGRNNDSLIAFKSK